MTLKSLFSFQGRFSRSQFWLWGFGLPALVGVLCVGLISALMLPSSDSDGVVGIFIVIGILYLPLTFVGIAGSVKRLHDLGRSGWWYLLTLIPLVNVGFVIWIGAFKGLRDPNQYGYNPLKVPAKIIDEKYYWWELIGVSGQYKGCVFPFHEDITFGTSPRNSSIVFDKTYIEDHKLCHPYRGDGIRLSAPQLLLWEMDTSIVGGSWKEIAINDGLINLGHDQIFQLKRNS